MKMQVFNPRQRGFCAGCGDVPISAYDLKRVSIGDTRRAILLCWPCWDDCLRRRPAAIPVTAVLEELEAHAYLAPQHRAAMEETARAGTDHRRSAHQRR